MNEGPIVVRRVGTVEEADLIVAWLDINGVEAAVLDRDNPGTLAFGVTDVGRQVQRDAAQRWLAGAESPR